MATKEELLLYRKIAKLRHCATVYDKNLDLMYDEEGNKTELRKEVNKILYRIATGELRSSFLSGVNFEIKYARKKADKLAKKKKKKKNKKVPTQEEQVSKLLKGLARVEKKEKAEYERNCLDSIGMRQKVISRICRKALPYYKEEN